MGGEVVIPSSGTGRSNLDNGLLVENDLQEARLSLKEGKIHPRSRYCPFIGLVDLPNLPSLILCDGWRRAFLTFTKRHSFDFN